MNHRDKIVKNIFLARKLQEGVDFPFSLCKTMSVKAKKENDMSDYSVPLRYLSEASEYLDSKITDREWKSRIEVRKGCVHIILKLKPDGIISYNYLIKVVTFSQIDLAKTNIIIPLIEAGLQELRKAK